MSETEIVVQGQIQPDGTLHLLGQPFLPAGPVEIVIRPLPAPQDNREDWWQYLQRARGELVAAGHRFRTKEEIDTEIADLRSGDDRWEEELRQEDAR